MKDDPSILMDCNETKQYLTKAEEEVFVIINNKTKQIISFDFEKRKLASRCIVRFIDYEKGRVSEVKAATPRFNIKSTFSSSPYGDSDITFLGGGFTASAVARKGKISIIASVPDLEVPDGRKGIKVEAHMTVNQDQKSYNYLLTHKNKTEALHTSVSDNISGVIRVGENKSIFSGDSLQGRHIWKRSTISKRKEKPLAIIYGKAENKPFSAVALTYDDSFSLTMNDKFERHDKIKWINKEKDLMEITDGDKINIKAKIFSSIHEKRGPFRRARTLRHAVFEGTMNGIIIEDAAGYIEYPDDIS